MMHILGLIHRLPLQQNELPVSSYTLLYSSKGRKGRWCLRSVLDTHTVPKMGPKTLQKGRCTQHGHAPLMAGTVLPNLTVQEAASNHEQQARTNSNIGTAVPWCGKGIACHLRTTSSQQWLHEEEQATADIPHVLRPLKIHLSRNC